MSTHRILILDDRKTRQEQDLGNLMGHLEAFPNVILKTKINDLQELEEYDILAIHRTYAVNNQLINPIIELIKRSNKYLIFFSGGIGEKRIDLKGHYLSLNSRVFYSQHLIDFINDLPTSEEVYLLKIIYGTTNWKIPLLFRYRHLQWLMASETNEDVKDLLLNEMDNIEDMFPDETDDVNEAIQTQLMYL